MKFSGSLKNFTHLIDFFVKFWRDFKIIITVQIPIKQVAQNGILQKVAEIKEKIQKTKAQEQAQINEEKQVEVLQKLKQSIISSVKSIGIFAVEVQEAGLISYLDEILNPNKQNEKREKIIYNSSATIKNHIQSFHSKNNNN